MKRTFWSIVIVAVLGSAITAFAHDVSTSYARLRAEGSRVHLQFTIALADFHNGPNLDRNGDGEISRDELDNGIATLANTIESNYRIQAPDSPSSVAIEGYDLQGPGVVRIDLLYIFSHAVRNLKITSTLDRVTQWNHQHLLVTGEGDETRQGVLDAKNPTVNIYLDGHTAFEIFSDFLTLGVERMLTGYDHLAFVAGLLLLTTTPAAVARVVASFMIGHSATLALATFNLVSPPSGLVQSLIALSVAILAIENFSGKTILARWKVSFLFGLVHGFGLSNALKEMDMIQHRTIALLSFNLGLEIGLVCFVGVAFPLVLLVARSQFKTQFLSAASLTIMCLGFYWFVQRAFLT